MISAHLADRGDSITSSTTRSIGGTSEIRRGNCSFFQQSSSSGLDECICNEKIFEWIALGVEKARHVHASINFVDIFWRIQWRISLRSWALRQAFALAAE